MTGKLRAFFETASMDADMGMKMLSPARSGIRGTIPRYFRNKGPKDQLDLLIWLFLFNEPVKVTALTGIFSPDDLNAMSAMNLIRLDSGVAICDFALFECAGLFLVTDAKVKPQAEVNPVLALFPECFDFVESVSRKPVNAALDLCTGSGVHGLVAARHSKHVVATDVSPRALCFAEFNAWFNGITNIEFCRGDLFGVVEGRTFDLILANPPFMPVIGCSPGDNSYCGGKSGDVLWSQILQGLEEHLRPDGLCQIIHMTILFGTETYENKIRALLGSLADFCSVVICSNPIAYRNVHTAAATSVHFGVTSIKRYPKLGGGVYMRAPFRPPLSLDVSDLFSLLEQTSSPEERTRVCQRCYTQPKRSRKLRGNGTAIRMASFVACCGLVLHRALRALLGMGKRRSLPIL